MPSPYGSSKRPSVAKIVASFLKASKNIKALIYFLTERILLKIEITKILFETGGSLSEQPSLIRAKI